MNKRLIASLLLALPLSSMAAGVGSLYSQVSRTCDLGLAGNGIPDTQLPLKESANANKLDPKVVKAFNKAYEANKKLLAVPDTCIDEVRDKYKELYGETIPVE
ncbi:hypothetical protein SMB77_003766 [Cronobacter sakazakii]|uniref:hypothetical protein n=1 Tax=Cronobacter sakazakii TaxID=28141 RepID=UPI00084E3541|nr:hypothetical protein [Cronobacter sakazakii]ELY4677587.1 hypothetical protein [Cronobacter turicensis]EGZ6869930.1 hypothetical protein [Cronobacter sakazakii]EKK4003395.1 hypothetical protein [Cronobacter sakazakii]EKK4025453.1 hypothetical protein [Cronobacter sakazakii]EKK4074918.1 hypothetical protein [Cronobacter sakazakii]